MKKLSNGQFNLGGPAPWCPLCINNANSKEHKMERGFAPKRKVYFFKCPSYNVRIRVDDPFVGKWDLIMSRMDAETKPKCPVPSCQTEMRYFARGADGYMKAVCPAKGCGATMASGEVRAKPVEGSLIEKAESGAGEAGVDKVYTPEKPGTVQ